MRVARWLLFAAVLTLAPLANAAITCSGVIDDSGWPGGGLCTSEELNEPDPNAGSGACGDARDNDTTTYWITDWDQVGDGTGCESCSAGSGPPNCCDPLDADGDHNIRISRGGAGSGYQDACGFQYTPKIHGPEGAWEIVEVWTSNAAPPGTFVLHESVTIDYTPYGGGLGDATGVYNPGPINVALTADIPDKKYVKFIVKQSYGGWANAAEIELLEDFDDGGDPVGTEWYVRTDGHDTNCDGTTNDACVSCAPESTCAFATPQGCIDNMDSGDTCYIGGGTYVGQGSAYYVPFFNVCEGPDGAALDYTTYKAADFNNKPLFCADAGCNPPTTGAQIGLCSGASPCPFGSLCQYIEFDGITVDGSFIMHGESNKWEVQNVRVTNSDFQGGFKCDNNWAPVRLNGVRDLWFHHNRLHDVDKGSCSGNDQMNGFVAFCMEDSTIEYNEFDFSTGTTVHRPVNDKASSRNNVWRYNELIGPSNEMHFNGQADCVDGGSFTQVYGNVLLDMDLRGAIKTDAFVFDNNTIINGKIHMSNAAGDLGWINFVLTDNLVQGTDTINVEIDGETSNLGHWSEIDTWTVDNNFYDPDLVYHPDWHMDGTERTVLADWQTDVNAAGCTGCDNPADEENVTFSAGTDTAYHLADNGQDALTAATDGGEVGAYGVTACVGMSCVCGDGDLDGAEACDGSAVTKSCAELVGPGWHGTVTCLDNGLCDEHDVSACIAPPGGGCNEVVTPVGVLCSSADPGQPCSNATDDDVTTWWGSETTGGNQDVDYNWSGDGVCGFQWTTSQTETDGDAYEVEVWTSTDGVTYTSTGERVRLVDRRTAHENYPLIKHLFKTGIITDTYVQFRIRNAKGDELTVAEIELLSVAPIPSMKGVSYP